MGLDAWHIVRATAIDILIAFFTLGLQGDKADAVDLVSQCANIKTNHKDQHRAHLTSVDILPTYSQSL